MQRQRLLRDYPSAPSPDGVPDWNRRSTADGSRTARLVACTSSRGCRPSRQATLRGILPHGSEVPRGPIPLHSSGLTIHPLRAVAEAFVQRQILFSILVAAENAAMAWKSKEERNAYNALIGAPETSKPRVLREKL